MHLYTINICTDGVIMDMCPCFLLVATSALCYWLGIFHYNMYICGCYVITGVLILLLMSYNIGTFIPLIIF